MLSLSDTNQTDIFEAFSSTSGYLDKLLILIIFILNKVYPTEFQFNKANTSDTEALFLILD